MIEFVAILGLFLGLLAGMAAVADWLGEPERRDARRRNHARRVK